MKRDTLRRRFGWWLRMLGDRVSPDTGPRLMTEWTFTFDPIPRRPAGPPIQIEWGMRFRQDGRGCPVWYMEEDYQRAHDEADTEHTVVLWENLEAGILPKTRRAGGESDAAVAGQYWDAVHRERLHGVPEQELSTLRARYIRDALANPEAIRQLREMRAGGGR